MIRVTVIHGLILGGLAALSGAPVFVVVSVVAWQIAESAAAPDRPDTADESARMLGAAVLAVVLGSVLFPSAPMPIGLGLVALGVALRVWAIRTLGGRFLDGVALLPRHPIERGGPYRWLSHPGALGTAVAALGVVLSAGSVVGAVAWIGLTALLFARTRAEDRLLLRAGCAVP